MIFDTDVIIWFLRGNAKAAKAIDNCDPRHLSTVSYLELLQGARNKKELKNIRYLLSDYSFQIIPLNENIGHRAIIYMEQYGLKVDLCLADALIAATSVEFNIQLYSGNRKHYRFIEDLDLKLFKV